MPQINPALDAMARIRAGESYEAVMADVTKASTAAATKIQDEPREDDAVMTVDGPAPHQEPMKDVVDADGKLNLAAFTVDGAVVDTPADDGADAPEDVEVVPPKAVAKPKATAKAKTTETDISSLMAEVAILKAELSSMKSPAQAAGAVKAAVEQMAEEDDVDAEDIEAFGEEGAKALAKYLKKRGITKNAIEAATKGVNKTAEDLAEATFAAGIKNSIKDFAEIVQSEDWLEYVTEEVNLTGKPVGFFLNQAHNERDAEKIQKIFNEFARRKAAKPGKSLTDLAKPSATRQAPAGVTGGPKNVLALSKLQRAMNDFQRGAITRERMIEIKEVYSTAQAEGRLDMTK